MAINGIQGTPKFKGATTDSDHDEQIADNLLNRNFAVDKPNTAWVGDITYLAVLIDLLVARLSAGRWRHMRTELCLDALNQALATREPAVGLVTTPTADRSTSATTTRRRWSPPGPSRRSSDEEARRAVSAYIHGIFNQSRLSTIDYKSPVAFEVAYRHQEAA